MTDLVQKDTTFTKIFVGGLPYHTTDKSLRQFFEAFGEIEEAVVITDRQTGKSRGYGFVTMSDREAAERAVKEANPIIDGRKANVNLAYLGAKPRATIHNGFTFPTVRTGYPALITTAGQYGLSPHYIYPHAAYLAAAAAATPPSLIVQPPLSPAAAGAAFYDYGGGGFPTAAQYASDAAAAAAAAAAAYSYPAAAPAGTTPAAAAAAYLQPAAAAYAAYTLPQPLPGMLPYAAAPTPQEARMQ